MDLFSQISDYVNSKSHPTFIFGDINLDCLKYGSCSKVTSYVDMLFTHGFLQLVTKPTRCTLTSATVIDHIITNSASTIFTTLILISQLSDHFPILHFIDYLKIRTQSKKITSRDTSDGGINAFNDSLSAQSWNNVIMSDDPQVSFNNFNEIFSALHEIHLPNVTKKFNKNYHKIEPWLTGGILTSRRTKISLEKKHFKNPTVASLSYLKTFRNLYTKILREAKKIYFEQSLHISQSNVKKTWDLIRTAMNKKTDKSSTINNIFVNNHTISDPQLIANHFNEFFTSIPSTIVEKINPSNNPPDLNQNIDIPLFSFLHDPVTETEIAEATKLLQPKKTQDINGISTFVLQKIITAISVPLCHIFRSSFAVGIVPSQLKIAKIVPVFKAGSKDLMDNYRPISLLSGFSKIIEKIVCNRLTSFLDFNNLISNSQYGFRKNHSTLHPLVHFLNYVSKALDKKEHCIAIFCDLRKAFDTCNHQILLKKLFNLGVRGLELKWFEDYLSNRMQTVTVNGAQSLLQMLNIGVPQGSILGPLLFLIYINDLPICSALYALLFADDTTLLMADSNIDNLISKANTEFKKVSDFFRAHKLALHPAKTKFILFTNNAEIRSGNYDIRLDFNNDGSVPDLNLVTNLERITTESDIPAVKFLGIFIDPNMNFKYHISSIISKVSKSMYFLRSVKNILTEKALKSVYYSLIHSHFVYGIQIWSCTSPGNLVPLSLKQKAAVRIVSGATYTSHTEPIFKKLAILPLANLIEFFKLQFMHKFINSILPKSFEFTWMRNEERRPNQANLRNSSEINIPLSRLAVTDRFPLYSFPRIWCNFNNNIIKGTNSKSIFNNNLKKFYLDKLSDVYRCTRLLCPSCHLQTQLIDSP